MFGKKSKKCKAPKVSENLKLVYWPIKARAFAIRMLLAAADAKYENEFVTDKAVWGETKAQLQKDTEFGAYANLPYLVDGDQTLYESMAILRYVARAFGFFANEGKAAVAQDIFENVLQDIMSAVPKARFGPNPKEDLEAWAKNYAKWEGINAALSKSKFLTGDSVNYVDFLALNYLDIMVEWSSDIYEKYENIARFKKDLLATSESLAEYYKSVEQVPCVPPLE